MNPSQGLTRFLAFTVLICCAGMGFCASLLGFTWATGDLPFGLQPMLHETAPEPEADVAATEEREQLARKRYGEVYASRLYASLKAERERLADESRKLEERAKELEAFRKTVLQLQTEMKAIEARARALLDQADTGEQSNVQHLASILAAAEAETGAKMLTSLPTETAARLIRGLDTRKAAELMDALIGGNGLGDPKKITELLDSLQKVGSPLPPSPKGKASNG